MPDGPQVLPPAPAAKNNMETVQHFNALYQKAFKLERMRDDKQKDVADATEKFNLAQGDAAKAAAKRFLDAKIAERQKIVQQLAENMKKYHLLLAVNTERTAEQLRSIASKPKTDFLTNIISVIDEDYKLFIERMHNYVNDVDTNACSLITSEQHQKNMDRYSKIYNDHITASKLPEDALDSVYSRHIAHDVGPRHTNVHVQELCGEIVFTFALINNNRHLFPTALWSKFFSDGLRLMLGVFSIIPGVGRLFKQENIDSIVKALDFERLVNIPSHLLNVFCGANIFPYVPCYSNENEFEVAQKKAHIDFEKKYSNNFVHRKGMCYAKGEHGKLKLAPIAIQNDYLEMLHDRMFEHGLVCKKMPKISNDKSVDLTAGTDQTSISNPNEDTSQTGGATPDMLQQLMHQLQGGATPPSAGDSPAVFPAGHAATSGEDAPRFEEVVDSADVPGSRSSSAQQPSEPSANGPHIVDSAPITEQVQATEDPAVGSAAESSVGRKVQQALPVIFQDYLSQNRVRQSEIENTIRGFNVTIVSHYEELVAINAQFMNLPKNEQKQILAILPNDVRQKIASISSADLYNGATTCRDVMEGGAAKLSEVHQSPTPAGL